MFVCDRIKKKKASYPFFNDAKFRRSGKTSADKEFPILETLGIIESDRTISSGF